ncbi:MAG TPA: IclR family transcriptional regulator, partial [Solirubrobacteraceae bacterium]
MNRSPEPAADREASSPADPAADREGSSPADPAADREGSSPAEQVARVLAAVLDRSPRTLGELSDEAAISEADLGPVLEALERHGLVAVDPDRASIRPGAAALRFARSDLGLADLVELARPGMRRLAAESGETANLILPRPGGTEAIAQIDGSHLLGVTNWVGRPLGLHATAAGKVFLAFGAAELADDPLEPLAPATITDRERLMAELETVRERGYATIVDELEPGLSAVAAPIREHGGAVVAVLCLSGASLRLEPQRLELLGRVTIEQSDEIS